MRRACIVLLSLGPVLSTAPLALAQTNDHLYRSWRWQEDLSAPRAAGLAGAFVAVADDASATALNPAGLRTLARPQMAAGLLRRGSGSMVLGDRVASGTDIGFLGAAAPIGSRLAAGAYLDEPRSVELDLAPATFPDRTQNLGFLDASVRNVGAALAFEVTQKLRLGAGVTGTRLNLSGVDSTYRRNGPEMVHTKTGGGDTDLTASAGLTYDPTERLRLGLLARTGASWSIDRSSFAPTTGLVIDPGSRYRVRQPDVYAGGASFRALDRLRVSGQVDYVRYSQIRETLSVRHGINPRDYRLDDAVEARMGAEWWRPIRSVNLEVRGGLYSQGPGSITYVGPDDTERLNFPGSSRRLLGALGGSVVTNRGVAFDVGTVFGGDRTVFAVGARYRF